MQRVVGKALPGAPHEVLLVLDATVGQNAIAQAKQFQDAVGVTGIALTKLDGTAKGGVIIGISDELKIPGHLGGRRGAGGGPPPVRSPRVRRRALRGGLMQRAGPVLIAGAGGLRRASAPSASQPPAGAPARLRAATSAEPGSSTAIRPGATRGPTTGGRWSSPSSAAGPTGARLPDRAAPRSCSAAHRTGFAGETRAPRGGPSGPLCDALIPVEVADCSDGGLTLRTVDRMRVDGRCAPVDAAPGERRTHLLVRLDAGTSARVGAAAASVARRPPAPATRASRMPAPPVPRRIPTGVERAARRALKPRAGRRPRSRGGDGRGQRLPVDGPTLEEAHPAHVEEADLEQHQERHRGPDVGVDGEPQRAGEVERRSPAPPGA